MAEAAKIIYTETDEAPFLATHSLLPILQAYTRSSGIQLETWDISLSGRIIANFPDNLSDEQRIPDYLRMCGECACNRRQTSSSCPTSAPQFPS